MHVRISKLVYLPLGGALGAGLLISAFVAPQPKLAASTVCYSACRTTSTLSLTKSSVSYGKESLESFRVTVAGSNAGTGKPTGLVQVDAGRKVLCSFYLRNGAGSCSVGNRALGPGTYSVQAHYKGGPGYDPSTSNTKRLPVLRNPSASSMYLTQYTVIRGRESNSEFRVSVKPSAAVIGNATGMVYVYTGRAALCHFTLYRGAGHCSLTNYELPTGHYTLRAYYRGNSYVAPSVSNIRHLNVKRS
jgi:hypothetical protein